MEQEFKKLKSAMRHVKMTDVERASLRTAIVEHMRAFPATESPSLFQSGISHGLRFVLSSFIFIVLIGGSVAAVANGSLPGDPLYSFKLDVNEKVRGLFVDTPEEKLALDQKRIEARFNEIKILAERQTLTKEKQSVVKKALSEHMLGLSKNLQETNPETALRVTAELEESLSIEKEVIESTISNTTEETSPILEAVQATIATVAEEEHKIIQKELDQLSEDVAQDALIDEVSEAIDPQEEAPIEAPAPPADLPDEELPSPPASLTPSGP